MTTEHFALQSARAATIAESTGRATMFLASISGGLIALGLVATASHLGTAFYAFGLVILPTLAFVGLVTFERALQTVPDLSTFRPQQRDLYVAPGRVGFWRAALRDPADELHSATIESIRTGGRITCFPTRRVGAAT